MLPILSTIPDSIKQQIADSLINFLAEQAKKAAGDQLAEKIRGFSSQRSLYQAVDQALKKGAERFTAEYMRKDEDLVAAITADPEFWKSQKVQQALSQMIRRPGAWLDEERRLLQEHFEDVLPGRVNRERVDTAVSYFLSCVVEELWTLPGTKEVREIYALQFQRMSVEATREQVALSRQQLEATREMSAEVRQTLLQLTSAMEKNLLAAPMPAALPAPRPKPYHNLPRPDYTRFVGREAELTWLRQRLSSGDRAWQIAITGIGGVGKSALALAIAHEYCDNYDRLSPEERFDAIIWISAKEEVLTASGKERAVLPEQVLRTLEDVYTAISRALDREDITRALPEDQGRVVEKALKEQRTLLVMDNLESVKDDRIKPFLRNLPVPTKAIITSREWLDVSDKWVLKGLNLNDSQILIQQETEARTINLSITQQERIYDLTSGLPLPIKLAIARFSSGESFQSIERWLGDATGDLPEYCIQGQAELARQRDQNAWQLLLACSLFDRGAGASSEALGYIVNLSNFDRDKGLAQLQRLFLVNRSEKDRFWTLPIVQRYSNAQLMEYKDLGQVLPDRWLIWLDQFAEEYHSDQDLEIEPCQEFAEEYPNILHAIKFCYEQQRWEQLANLAINTIAFTVFSSFIDLNDILSAANEAITHTGNEIVKGEIELQLGRMVWWSKGVRRNDYFERAEAIFKMYMNSDQPEIWAKLLTVYIYLVRHEEAEEIASRIYAYGDAINDNQLKYVGAYRLAEIKMWKGENKYNITKAQEWLSVAENLARELGGPRNIAAVLYRQAEAWYSLDNLNAAESLFLQVLQMDTSRRDFRRVAYDKVMLASIYLRTGQKEVAEQYAQESSELFDRLGMVYDLNRSRKLIEVSSAAQMMKDGL
jgi:hypothetical protein